jgi:hypothetical protein
VEHAKEKRISWEASASMGLKDEGAPLAPPLTWHPIEKIDIPNCTAAELCHATWKEQAVKEEVAG